MNFICTFELIGHEMKVESDDMGKLKYGFYIDNQNRFTEITECCRYWIPPGAIKHIEIESD